LSSGEGGEYNIALGMLTLSQENETCGTCEGTRKETSKAFGDSNTPTADVEALPLVLGDVLVPVTETVSLPPELFGKAAQTRGSAGANTKGNTLGCHQGTEENLEEAEAMVDWCRCHDYRCNHCDCLGGGAGNK